MNHIAQEVKNKNRVKGCISIISSSFHNRLCIFSDLCPTLEIQIASALLNHDGRWQYARYVGRHYFVIWARGTMDAISLAYNAATVPVRGARPM